MKITRDELLIAAFKLFMSVNYEKASFAELGKMLGMSKAGIFKYYKNKQELFIAVVDTRKVFISCPIFSFSVSTSPI